MPGSYKVVLLQLAVTVVLTLAFWAAGADQGRAALMGGLAVGLPNAYFAYVATSRRSAEGVLANGVVKFVLGLTLIAVALKVFEPPPLGFFSGLIGAILAHAVGGAGFSTNEALKAASATGAGNED